MTFEAYDPDPDFDPDGGNCKHTGAYGSIGFERPDNLIPYNQLQENTVIG